MRIASLFILVCWISTASAKEVRMTDEQRLANRDVVCIATVVSTERISNINKHDDLFLAVIKVEGMKKGKKTSIGSTLHVYYEFSSIGMNLRRPKYVELEKGDKGTFYLQWITSDIKTRLGLKDTDTYATFLELGSDIQKTNTEPVN